jgi:hypothetical protein
LELELAVATTKSTPFLYSVYEAKFLLFLRGEIRGMPINKEGSLIPGLIFGLHHLLKAAQI